MNPVRPVPPWAHPAWEEVIYAKDQPEYRELPVLRNLSVPEVPVLSCWEPTPEERDYLMAELRAGRPIQIFVTQLIFKDKMSKPNPLTPLRVEVWPTP